MIFTSFLILIVAKALYLIYNNLSHRDFFRISPIIFLYVGVFYLNTFYIQLIGSGIGIYSGLFLLAPFLVDTFLFFIPSFLVMNYLLFKHLSLNSNNYQSTKFTST